MKSKFLAFEGLDGSGQTTQCKLLKDYLNGNSKALLTKEPTNNLVGGLIRAALTHEWKPSPEGLQLLFAADRSHHLNREVIPALKKGLNVITDRYFFSSIAYGAVETDYDWLKQINSQFRLPDHTFFLKVPPKVCMERMQASRFELELFEKEKYLEKVFDNFMRMSKEYENFHVINGENYVEDIHKEIKEILRE